MRLDSRISKLENTMTPKQYHALRYVAGEQTEQEVVEAYCNKRGFDPERFMNEEYGRVMIIVREIVSPGEIRNDD
jgi:hypothetical protein